MMVLVAAIGRHGFRAGHLHIKARARFCVGNPQTPPLACGSDSTVSSLPRGSGGGGGGMTGSGP